MYYSLIIVYGLYLAKGRDKREYNVLEKNIGYVPDILFFILRSLFGAPKNV